jgi:hypothetical protein
MGVENQMELKPVAVWTAASGVAPEELTCTTARARGRGFVPWVPWKSSTFKAFFSTYRVDPGCGIRDNHPTGLPNRKSWPDCTPELPPSPHFVLDGQLQPM